jgi:hypothetical protein
VKRETARLLRAVLRLIEDDVRDISDAVVEIDQREAEHYRDHSERLTVLEHRLAVDLYGPHSVKA